MLRHRSIGSGEKIPTVYAHSRKLDRKDAAYRRRVKNMKSKMLITTLLLALSLLALPCAAENETEEQPDPPLTGETLIVHEREPSVIRRVPLDEVEEPVTAADGENSPSADADGGGDAVDSSENAGTAADGAAGEGSADAETAETEETLVTELGAIDPGPESDGRGGAAVLVGAVIAAAAAVGAIVVFRRGGVLDRKTAADVEADGEIDGDGYADDAAASETDDSHTVDDGSDGVTYPEDKTDCVENNGAETADNGKTDHESESDDGSSGGTASAEDPDCTAENRA